MRVSGHLSGIHQREIILRSDNHLLVMLCMGINVLYVDLKSEYRRKPIGLDKQNI